MRPTIVTLLRAGLLALAAGLAACGSGGGGGGGGGGNPDPPGTPRTIEDVEEVRAVTQSGMFLVHAADGRPYFYRNYTATRQALKPLVAGQRLAVDALSTSGAIVGRALDNGPGLLYWSSPTAAPVRVKQRNLGRTAFITGINRAGQMVGWEALSPDRALFWPRFDSEPVALPTRPGGVAAGDQGRAYGLTDSGLAYGVVGDGTYRLTYWRLKADGTAEGTFNMSSAGGRPTQVLQVNAQERAVGQADRGAGADPRWVAVVYAGPESEATHLTWGANAKSARARYVNRGALVVGRITDGADQSQAVVWPAAGAPFYLQTLLADGAPKLLEAVAVTDDNLIFCVTDQAPATGRLTVLKWPY